MRTLGTGIACAVLVLGVAGPSFAQIPGLPNLLGTPAGVEPQASKNPKDFPRPNLVEGKTVATRPPHSGHGPAFPEQTRAPYHASKPVKVTTISTELKTPWGFAILPGGRFLISERLGTMRILSEDGKLSQPLANVPPVVSAKTSGLHDVILDPDFAKTHRIFFSFAEARGKDMTGISIARAVLNEKTNALENVTVIFRALPGVPVDPLSTNQAGRLAFGRDGMLYATIGDRSASPPWDIAQNLDTHLGKIIRITKDGAPAPGNPFAATKGALPEIWSYGHRNQLGLALHPVTGVLWETENGPWGGDELNIVAKGKNYGWPYQVHGRDYQGNPLGAGKDTAMMEKPVYYWDPIIAPSGLAFYEGALFPEWKGSVLVGAMRGRHLTRLTMKDGKVIAEEPLLIDVGSRLRDVRIGPEGAVYVASEDGKFLKLTPQ
jgi:glucose/arabinose dehydrogenase